MTRLHPLTAVPWIALLLIAAPAALAEDAETSPSAASEASEASPPAPDGAPRALPRGPRAGGEACRADIQRLCAGQRGKPGQVRGCLREHLDELDPGCRQHVTYRRKLERDRKQAQGRGRRLRAACAEDLKSVCTEESQAAGPGGLARCLRDNEETLSEECRTELGPRRGPQTGKAG